MPAVRFTTTRLGGLRAAGRSSELQHAAIVPFLERELGPRHARLFADFEAEGSGVRAWYAETDTPPRRIDDLPEDQAKSVRTAVTVLIRDVKALADRLAGEGPHKANLARILLASTVFPEEDVWCAGNQPIIVNWGFERQQASEHTPRAITAAGLPRRNAAAAPMPRGRFLLPRPGRRLSAAAAPLWLLFVILLTAIYRALLPACGLDPRLKPFANWWLLDTCEGFAALANEATEGARLQALVRQRELEVARERRFCEVPRKVGRPSSSPPVRTSTAEKQVEQQIEERLPLAAPRGRVEISLVWDGHADLDLIVVCPHGDQLSQASPGLSACGGRLLQDINKAGGPKTDHPIEHAAWDRPAPGSYTVKVQLYEYNDVSAESDIPFTIRIRQDATDEVHAGQIKGVRATVTAATVTF